MQVRENLTLWLSKEGYVDDDRRRRRATGQGKDLNDSRTSRLDMSQHEDINQMSGEHRFMRWFRVILRKRRHIYHVILLRRDV